MPGVITGTGPQSLNDQQERAQFANDIAGKTGLDPRVVSAWAQQETGGHPYGGFHNWLNLRPYPGDPYIGVSPGNFEEYRNLADAETATLRRLRMPFAAPIISSAGKSPAEEIAAIASTGWDAGHYGGPGGPNLRNTFASLFGADQLGKVAPGDLRVSSAGGAGTGVVGSQGALGGVWDTVTAIPKALEFIFSYRFLEILGGGLLLLLGLYLLAQQLKVSFPKPPGGDVANKAVIELTPEARGALAVEASHERARARGDEGLVSVRKKSDA